MEFTKTFKIIFFIIEFFLLKSTRHKAKCTRHKEKKVHDILKRLLNSVHKGDFIYIFIYIKHKIKYHKEKSLIFKNVV